MADKSDHPTEDTDKSRNRPFGNNPFARWQRVVLLMLGASMVGAGAVSVFVSENGLGSASLVVGGLAALVLVFTGRLVRLRVGDTEAEWAVTEDLGDVTFQVGVAAVGQEEGGAPELAESLRSWQATLEDVLRRLMEGGTSEKPVPSRIYRDPSRRDDIQSLRRAGLAYETWVGAVAQLATQNDGPVVVEREWQGVAGVWDFSIGLPGGRLLMDVLYRREDSDGRPVVLSPVLRTRFGTAAAEIVVRDGVPKSVLIVTNVPTEGSSRWTRWTDEVETVSLVVASQTPEGEQDLITAIQEALRRLEAED